MCCFTKQQIGAFAIAGLVSFVHCAPITETENQILHARQYSPIYFLWWESKNFLPYASVWEDYETNDMESLQWMEK